MPGYGGPCPPPERPGPGYGRCKRAPVWPRIPIHRQHTGSGTPRRAPATPPCRRCLRPWQRSVGNGPSGARPRQRQRCSQNSPPAPAASHSGPFPPASSPWLPGHRIGRESICGFLFLSPWDTPFCGGSRLRFQAGAWVGVGVGSVTGLSGWGMAGGGSRWASARQVRNRSNS